MTKDDLHSLIQADREAQQDLLRNLVSADRRAREEDMRRPTLSDGRERWQDLILLCRMAHDTLDQQDEEADEPVGAYPEPLESLRRRLVNVRRLLKAAQADQDAITALRLEVARLRDERDEAQRQVHMRLKRELRS